MKKIHLPRITGKRVLYTTAVGILSSLLIYNYNSTMKSSNLTDNENKVETIKGTVTYEDGRVKKENFDSIEDAIFHAYDMGANIAIELPPEYIVTKSIIIPERNGSQD